MGLLDALPAGGVSDRPGKLRAALLHDGPAVARARQLRAVGARVRLVRGAAEQRAARVRGRVSVREARRRSRAQARRDVDARRACTSCSRCSRRIGSSPSTRASSCTSRRSVSGCRAAITCTRATASRAASRTCRCAACRSPELREEGERRARDAASHQRCGEPRVPAAAARAHRLAARRAAPRQHARHGRARRGRADRGDPGARQSLVRGRLVHGPHDPALSTPRISSPRTSSPRSRRACSRSARASSRASEHALFFALATAAVYPAGHAGAARGVRREARDDSRADAPLGGAVPREHRAHAAARRGRVRAAARRPHRGGRPLRPRDRGGARAASYLNIEALGRRARGALLARATASRTSRRIYLDKALRRVRGVGRDRQGRRSQWPSTGSAPASSATVSVTAELHDARARPPERSDALDLATLLKASQAIAGEIVLERLLVKLMDIIRENAGAESVVLVLESNGEFLVQGVKTAAGVARVLAAEPLRLVGRLLARASSTTCCARRSSWCSTTPRSKASSATTPTSRNRRPKSMLCAPVAHKGKLIGAVYLENNQVAGRVHAGSPRGAQHPDVAGGGVDRERDALQPPRAAEPRDRSRQRHADEGDRRAQARRGRAQPLQGPPRGPRQGAHARAREGAGAARRAVAARRHGRGRFGRAAQRRQRHEQRQRRRQHGARGRQRAAGRRAHARRGAARRERGRLAEYLATDPVGRKLPDYLRKLGASARGRETRRSSATSTSSPSTSST